MGSDHCPVSCELFDEIYEGNDKLLLFKEGNLTTQTPSLCAKNLARFSGNQQTLRSFFTKQEIKEKETQEKKFEALKTSNDEIISPKIEEVINSTISSDSSKHDISEGLKGQTDTERRINQALGRQVYKVKPSSSKVKKEKNSKAQTKSKLPLSTNQASLMSFFKKTSLDIPSEKKLEKVTELIEPVELIDYQGLQEKSIDSENLSDSSNSSEKFLDDMLNNIEDECTEIPSSNNKKDIQSQWNALFKPRPIPNCIEHGEPCKEYTVNKPGINQGRRFYLCSRPVGNSQESRCDYFEWVNGKKSKSIKRSYSIQKRNSESNKKKRV